MTKTNADAAEKASEELRALGQLKSTSAASEDRKNREGVLSRFAVAVGVGGAGDDDDVVGNILIAVLRETPPPPPVHPPFFSFSTWVPQCLDTQMPCNVDAMEC